MRLFSFIGCAFAALAIAAPAIAQDAAKPIPVKTVYQDGRLVCGNENSTEYKVRLMVAVRKQVAKLRAEGYAPLIVKLGPNDPPAVVAPARTVVFSTFHNIYRDGRVGAGYDTLEHARRVRNGPGRIDRRDIYNDGTTQMVENVQQP